MAPFYTKIHPVYGSRATQGRELPFKKIMMSELCDMNERKCVRL